MSNSSDMSSFNASGSSRNSSDMSSFNASGSSRNSSDMSSANAMNSSNRSGSSGFNDSVCSGSPGPPYSNRKDLPEDLAFFLQQQKQRQARLETTMRSFPSSLDVDQERLDLKRKRTTHEDPLSHRVIEKRRRDRMNSCLADLSRLIPTSYMKKGKGRVEKTEIIEMAIKHMKHLQTHACSQEDGCEMATEIEDGLHRSYNMESFRIGYHECLTELMHFLVEKEGLYSGDAFCVRMMTHLQKHYDRLGRAKTSEVMSNFERTWAGTTLPSETASCVGGRESRDGQTVKSEISEESGYFSLKQDDDAVNLSVHDNYKHRRRFNGEGEFRRGARPEQRSFAAHGDRRRNEEASSGGSRERWEEAGEGRRDRSSDSQSVEYRGDRATPVPLPPTPQVTDEAEDEKPSDLSLRNSTSSEPGSSSSPYHQHHRQHHHSTQRPEDPSDSYKFKSNITQRFSLQDTDQSDPGAALDSGKNHGKNGGDPDSEVICSDMHPGIKLEADCASRRNSSAASAAERARRFSNGGGSETGLLPVIRERLLPLPPLPGFSPPDRDAPLSAPGGNAPPSLPPMDLLMPTLAPIPPPASPVSSPSRTPPVPIFALNAKGSYYVPMSVDLAVIAPFMALYNEETYTVLHPVTISVNFQAGHAPGGPPKPRSGVIQQPSVIKQWKENK